MKKHDYGLDKKKELALIGNGGRQGICKRVILTNVRSCKNRITVDKIMKCINESGIPELALAEAIWLVEAVVNAINNHNSTADISRMFNFGISIYGEGGYKGTITKESISEMLYESLFKKN